MLAHGGPIPCQSASTSTTAATNRRAYSPVADRHRRCETGGRLAQRRPARSSPRDSPRPGLPSPRCTKSRQNCWDRPAHRPTASREPARAVAANRRIPLLRSPRHGDTSGHSRPNRAGRQMINLHARIDGERYARHLASESRERRRAASPSRETACWCRPAAADSAFAGQRRLAIGKQPRERRTDRVAACRRLGASPKAPRNRPAASG